MSNSDKTDKSKLNKSIDKAISEGALYVKFYFDIHGKSGESLKEMATGFVGKIIEYPGVIYANGEIDEPIEDNGLISVPIEVDVLVNDFPTLIRLSMDFIPYSVEVIKPLTGVKLNVNDIHDVVMDASTTSFNYRKYIIERASTPHDREVYSRTVKNRIALGKKLLSKKEAKNE